MNEQQHSTTLYFREQVLQKRPYLTLEICAEVLRNHYRREEQEDGRIRYWGYAGGLERALRVVTLEDGRTLHNAFLDRAEPKRTP